MHLIGRGRYAREVYPSPPNAASVAAKNRNVAAPPIFLVSPFTPVVGPAGSLLAAILFTPKVSGVIQVTAELLVTDGATGETFTAAAKIIAGTNLTLTGGATTNNGWTLGSTVPPVVGGTGLTTAQVLGLGEKVFAANEISSLAIAAAVSQPLPLGVPVAVEISLASLSGLNPVSGIGVTSLSIMELP